MQKLLTDLCYIQYGYTFDSACFTEDNSYPPLVRIRDVKRGYSETFYLGDFPKEYILHKGDLLIGMDGEFNIARWKSNDALLNQRVCKIVAMEGIDEEYLRFALSKALKVIEDRTAFVTVKHLSAKELNKLVLDIPTYDKQKSISASLTKLEDVISLRENELMQLDNLIKSRFIEMFNNNNFEKDELNRNVEEMFIGPFGSSLKNDCFVEKDKSYCMVYEQKHAIQKTMNVPTRYVNYDKFKELQRFNVIGGDIIVSCRGTIGEIYSVPINAPLGIMHPSIMKIRLKKDKYCNLFFVYLLEQYMQENINKANGTGIKMAVSAKELGKERFVLPPIHIQKDFENFVKQTDKLKIEVQKSLDKTQLLFNSLMQEYFG